MPDWRSEIERIITPLGLSPAREASVTTELEQHLTEHYADLLAQGVPEDHDPLVQSLGENRTLAVVSQVDPRVESPNPEDLFQVGTLCVMHKAIKVPKASPVQLALRVRN